MKTILRYYIAILIFNFSEAFGQNSIEITPGFNKIQSNTSNNLELKSNGGWLNPLTLTTQNLNEVNLIMKVNDGLTPAGVLCGRFDGIGLAANSVNFKVFVNKNDNVGINTRSPNSQLEVNGFTKLGSDAPAIKVKKITSTTRSTQGAQVIINHGLTDSKILSISVMVDTETNDFIHPSYRSSTGYEFEWTSFNGSIYVKNVTDNSANILSKPIKVLITYEE